MLLNLAKVSLAWDALVLLGSSFKYRSSSVAASG